MATYTVSYRGKNGERIEEQFDAPDRNSLFKILADRKISAISVKDGAAPKRKKSSTPSKPLPPAVIRSAFVGLMAIMLVGAFYLILGNRDKKSQDEKIEKTKLIQEVTPSVAESNGEKIEETIAPVVVEKPKHPNFGRTPVEVDENGDRWVVRNGRRRKVIRGGQVGTSRQLWHNMAENQISALVTVKPGQMIVGFELQPGFKEEFTSSMLGKIEVTPEDTPEEAEEKMLVKEAKANLVEALKNGEDIEEIMRNEYKNVMKLYNYRQNLVAELQELRERGASAQELDDYVKAANVLLERQGIDDPVRLRRKERYLLNRDTVE